VKIFSSQVGFGFCSKLLLSWALIALVGCSSFSNRPPAGLFTHPDQVATKGVEESGADFHESLFKDVPQSELALLDRGGEGFLARLALIENASKSIDAQYYLWSREGTGLILVDRLIAAADRGVKVRLLVDEFLLEPTDMLLAALSAHKNVEFRFYNPSTYGKDRPLAKAFDWIVHFGKLDHRMHNKLFIADGKVVIMGGRNIGDDYFGAHTEFNFRDFDVIFRGEAVSGARASFNEFWRSNLAKPVSYRFHKKVGPIQIEQYARDLDKSVAKLDADEGFSLPVSLSKGQAKSYLDKLFARAMSAKILVIADHPEKDGLFSHGSVIGPAYLQMQYHSKEELLIVNPYFVPYDWEIEGMKGFVERGGRIRFLTNSMATNNQGMVHAKYARLRRGILKAGVKLHEIRPDALRRHYHFSTRSAGDASLALHGKAAIFDDKRVYIGTFNFDPRSAALNTEMGLLIESKAFAAQLKETLEADFGPANSWSVRSTGVTKLEWEGVDEKGEQILHQKEPMTTGRQRFKSWFFGLLPFKKEV